MSYKLPPKPQKEFYVYRIYDESGTLYVGKGTGSRLSFQVKRFNAMGEVIEVCKTEGHAFKRECYWVEHYKPPLNRTIGGGGRKRSKPRGVVYPKLKNNSKVGVSSNGS